MFGAPPGGEARIPPAPERRTERPTAPRASSTSSRATGAKARSLTEHWIAVLRTGNVVNLLPGAPASSAWVLAQHGESTETLNRLRESEQLVERDAARAVGAGGRGN